jgi:hypothetical protein
VQPGPSAVRSILLLRVDGALRRQRPRIPLCNLPVQSASLFQQITRCHSVRVLYSLLPFSFKNDIVESLAHLPFHSVRPLASRDLCRVPMPKEPFSLEWFER